MQAPVEPGFGELQVAVNGGASDAQKLGRLFVSATQEIAQLDDTNLTFVQKLQLSERLVERQHLFARRVDPDQIGVQGNSPACPAGTFLRMGATAEIAEDPAHQHCRE